MGMAGPGPSGTPRMNTYRLRRPVVPEDRPTPPKAPGMITPGPSGTTRVNILLPMACDSAGGATAPPPT